MFLQIAGFLLLTGFAGVLTGGVYLGRRVARLAALKGRLEEAKVTQQLNVVEHQVRVEAHSQGLQVLALTVGTPIEPEQTVDDIPEKVKIEDPHMDIYHLGLSKDEWEAKQRDAKHTKDGQWAPV